MTLEEKAEESSKRAFCVAHTHEDELIFKNGYITGAEPREKRIKELEQQIQDIIGMLNDILWKCTCKEYEKVTQELKELINKWEIEND